MREYEFYVYILATRKKGTLYIGVTSDIGRRMQEHKDAVSSKSFAAKYGVAMLVYYETYTQIMDAIVREKQLKNWKRGWKIQLIESANPYWHDLSVI